MFRYFLFCALLLTSCNNTDRFAEAAFQNKVDSVVNSRLDSVQSSLQRRNDSLIVEAAHRRADSLRKTTLPLVPATPRPRADSTRPVQP